MEAVVVMLRRFGLLAALLALVLVACEASVSTPGSSVGVDSPSGSDAVVPSAPTGLVVSPGDAQITISFTAASDGGSPMLNYEYLVSGSGWVAFSPSVTDLSVPTSLTHLFSRA